MPFGVRVPYIFLNFYLFDDHIYNVTVCQVIFSVLYI